MFRSIRTIVAVVTLLSVLSAGSMASAMSIRNSADRHQHPGVSFLVKNAKCSNHGLSLLRR